MSIVLRDYQQRAVDETWQWFRNNKEGNPLAVLPTGAGKSIICAKLALDAISFRTERSVRVLVVTHSKELVEQNYQKFKIIAPTADVGIFSASLKRKDRHNQIIFASIQSIYRANVGAFDIIICDECHRIPHGADGTYRHLFERMTELNPILRVIGMTATPFRLKGGRLDQGAGALFAEVATEVSIIELLDNGHLARMKSWKSAVSADLKGVKKVAGDYSVSAMADVMINSGVTERALADMRKKAAARQAILIFCCDIEHCEQTTAIIAEWGWSVAMITGKTKPDHREALIEQFRAGELRVLVNCQVLTTGFDAPICDCIVMLRGTQSTSLYIQMAGRGMRTYPTKADCLLLDYVGNIERHGCLDDPNLYAGGMEKGGGEGEGDAPTKHCPECEFIMPLGSMTCPECGYVIPPPERRIEAAPSELSLLSNEPELYRVSKVTASAYYKNGTNSLRVTYWGNAEHKPTPFGGMFPLEICTEWHWLEHSDKGFETFRKWWFEYMQSFSPPDMAVHAAALITENKGLVAPPLFLAVVRKGKYRVIIDKH